MDNNVATFSDEQLFLGIRFEIRSFCDKENALCRKYRQIYSVVVEEYLISLDNIVCLVADNASNMIKAANEKNLSCLASHKYWLSPMF